jgi:hypothetical protein
MRVRERMNTDYSPRLCVAAVFFLWIPPLSPVVTLRFSFLFDFADLLFTALVPSTQPYTSKCLERNEMHDAVESLGLKCYCWEAIIF